MEARIARVVSVVTLLVGFCSVATAPQVRAAGYKTANFTVAAPTPELAKAIGDQAEIFRRDLAIEWLGHELPTWSQTCPIHAKVAQNLGAGGATTFIFDRGEVYGWKMSIQGSRERILDSVLPHEVTHTIFASYFRQPLPRWADEGACTTVEHRSEIAKQEKNLIQYLQTGRGIPFSQLFAMKEYPSDVMPLYAQGHSLAEWLIESRGRKEFLAFLADGMRDENWPRAVQAHYSYNNLLSLQTAWNEWVRAGRPQIGPATGPAVQVAANTPDARTVAATPTGIRLQSPDNRMATTPAAAALTPITPIAPQKSTPTTAVTVASASQSVYAAAAQRAENERRALDVTVASASASVYDASRGNTKIRR